MTIKERVRKFQDLLSDLSNPGKLESQFMITLVEDWELTVGELPDEGCDHLDQTTRETWEFIHGQCREILDAFEPRSAKDKDALLTLSADSNSINLWMEVTFKRHMRDYGLPTT